MSTSALLFDFFTDQKIQSHTEHKSTSIWWYLEPVVWLFLHFSTSWRSFILFFFSHCLNARYGVNNNSIDFQSQVLLSNRCEMRTKTTIFSPHSLVVFVNMTIKYYQEYVHSVRCTFILSVMNARTVNALLHMPQAVLYNVRVANIAMSLIDLVVSKTTNKIVHTCVYTFTRRVLEHFLFMYAIDESHSSIT